MKFCELDFNHKDDYTIVGEKILCHSKDAVPFFVRYYSHLSEKEETFFENCLHIHDYNELIIFLSSNFTMNINGTILMPEVGDVIVTRSGEPHCCTNLMGGTISYIQIDIPDGAFDGILGAELFEACFKKREFCSDNLISLPDADSDILMKYVKKLIGILNLGKHHQMLIYSYIIQIMNVINDVFLQEKVVDTDKYLPNSIFNAVRYIRDNITSVKNIEEVAEHINVSVSYLSRTFKKHLGYTPHEYILLQRIEYAKRLLCHHDKNVSEACYESGFSDYSNFINTFKRKVGVTPLVYKKTSS